MKEEDILVERYEISERLRRFRESSGCTQERFAEILGISLSAYKKIESAENQITIKGLRKLNDKFGVSVDYLLFGEKRSFDATWEMIVNCSDREKLFLMLRLFNYFADEKSEIFVDKKSLKQSDEKIRKFVDMLDL